jgi:hypothetical protein
MSLVLLAMVICFPDLQAQFSIGPGGFITVKQGGKMMIGTDLHIKSIAGSSGALADQNVNGDITITGDVLVERYMTADEWHNVASPVSNESTGCFTGTDLVFWYDETMIWNDWNFGWVWYSGTTGGPLMVYRGYDVFFATIPVTVNYAATGTETLNTGAYTLNITNTDPAPNPFEIPSHKGWNLAGNPYPSPVDWLAASGWNKTDINDAKYIWDGLIDVYTIFVGGGSPFGLNGGTRFIPSNQGFWVQALHNGTISINNAVRLGSMTATPDFYKLSPVDYPLICIVAAGNTRQDEIAVRFIEGTTAKFDVNYDATKLFSPVEDVPQLSIKSGDQSFALNTLPAITDNMDIHLDFHCGKAGYYTIKLSARTNLDPSMKIYLKDDLEDKITNLALDSSCIFHHKPSNEAGRFHLLLNPSDDVLNQIGPESYFTVFSENNRIVIFKNTTQALSGEIIVYSMLGQPVCREILSNDKKSLIKIDAPTGYYIVSIFANQYISNHNVLIYN